MSCDVRLFADDKSLFSVVNDVATTAFEMNYDLEKIKLWAWQWKMQFNTEKTEEVIFSTKRIKPDHPPLKLGDDVISQTLEHKHLGMVLDSKLDFKIHLVSSSFIVFYLAQGYSNDFTSYPLVTMLSSI